MNPSSAPISGRHRPALWLGIFSFAVVLAAHHVADGDLWGKLAIGAHVWHYGTVPDHDTFAFTPVLPHYVEHEWGAGTIFFGVLKFFGPPGLMLLKILLAVGALLAALAAGRKNGCSWETLLLLAVPVAWVELLGYVPVIRSHAFTYCFFAVTLLALEEIRAAKKWPLFVLPPLFLVWSNIHGGFVAGLGAIGVYAAFALPARKHFKAYLLAGALCGAVTFLNIYGLKFWPYLVPAILMKRPAITEWQPLPLWGDDIFNSFRVLFFLVAAVLFFGWRQVQKKNWPGLALLAITALLAWRSRRHAPFFGVAALAFAGPFLQALLLNFSSRRPARVLKNFKPAFTVTVLYGALAVFTVLKFLPQASFDVLAPVGNVPVREADILARAQAGGNLATPFGWGCYCSWRLNPRVKISMDGRYETTYPEATFALNDRFYNKSGPDWDRLIRDYQVDYVILACAQEPLRPEDLVARGYVLVWQTGGLSALLCLPQHAEKLRQAAAGLPPTTVNPLDAKIPDAWWPR
ncbi:MAG TPA: hypothetical protein VGI63_04115 [Verrucomicrobiae bacterium]